MTLLDCDSINSWERFTPNFTAGAVAFSVHKCSARMLDYMGRMPAIGVEGHNLGFCSVPIPSKLEFIVSLLTWRILLTRSHSKRGRVKRLIECQRSLISEGSIVFFPLLRHLVLSRALSSLCGLLDPRGRFNQGRIDERAVRQGRQIINL